MSEITGRNIHHVPSNGTDEKRDYLATGYQRTLVEYERFFGTPPALLWQFCPENKAPN